MSNSENAAPLPKRDRRCVTVLDSSGGPHMLSRYWASWDQPRPESFREDSELVRTPPHKEHKADR